MTRVAIAAAVCAVGFVLGAGAIVVLDGADQVAPVATAVVRTTTTSVPATTSPTPTTPSPTATTAPTVPRGPLTTADAEAVIPKAGDVFGPADLEVKLGSVCEGATFDLVGATPVYASLQSADDPLQYLDAVVVVYDTVPSASTAYERLAEAVTLCPPSRTATPAPTAAEEAPIAVEIDGEVIPDVLVGERPGIQWVQVQSADGSELRTAITVVLVENVLVAISMDEDSETTEAGSLAEDSLAQAGTVVAALLAAVG